MASIPAVEWSLGMRLTPGLHTTTLSRNHNYEIKSGCESLHMYMYMYYRLYIRIHVHVHVMLFIYTHVCRLFYRLSLTLARLAMVSGTPSWSLSSMAVAPRRVRSCSIFSYTCTATEKRERERERAPLAEKLHAAIIKIPSSQNMYSMAALTKSSAASRFSCTMLYRDDI